MLHDGGWSAWRMVSGWSARWRWWAVSLVLLAPLPAWAACAPDGSTRASLDALRNDALEKTAFDIQDQNARVSLAITMVDCLASADPALRDGIAYASLQRGMRARAFSADTLRTLRSRLFAMIDAPDPNGVARPFAALVLSELARTDRIEPWMREDEREEMVARAAEYLASVDDYRGYEPDIGWRHGVAHGADWTMQLALNPALTRAQLDRLLQAIAAQAVPATPHAYVFGEPGRLARPLLYIAKRGLHSESEWTAWCTTLVSRVGDAEMAWQDAGWLARRHDLAALLHSLYVEIDVEIDRGGDPAIARMKPGVVAALQTLP